MAPPAGETSRTLLVEISGTAVGTLRLTRNDDAAGIYGFAGYALDLDRVDDPVVDGVEDDEHAGVEVEGAERGVRMRPFVSVDDDKLFTWIVRPPDTTTS